MGTSLGPASASPPSAPGTSRRGRPRLRWQELSRLRRPSQKLPIWQRERPTPPATFAAARSTRGTWWRSTCGAAWPPPCGWREGSEAEDEDHGHGQRDGSIRRRGAAPVAGAPLARGVWPHRDAHRVRPDELRRVHGAPGGGTGEVLDHVRCTGRWPLDHDCGGSAPERAAPSDPGGVQGRARASVRVLHPWHDADRRCPLGEQSGADGGRRSVGHLRQHLPLHRLHEHREGDPGSRPGHVRTEGAGRDELEGDTMATEVTEIRGVGHSVRRKEDDRFIQGRGTYIDDVKLPGMLHMAILRSPLAHAKINSIDTSKAAALPGVVAVVTGELMAQHNLAWMPTLSYDTQAVLVTDKVRFQGQEVAAVIAEDPYVAKDALELIDVDYEPLEALVDPYRALEPNAPVIRDEKEGQKDNRIYHWEAGDKDATDKAFADADKVVALDTFYPRCHPAPLETCGCVADVNPATGQTTIYMTSQAPHAHRTVFALVAGIPEENIRIISPDIGGGFGNQEPVYSGC